MAEQQVWAQKASVFKLDPVTKKNWAPTTSGQVNVAIYKNPSTGAQRIVGLAVVDNAVIINCMLTKELNAQKGNESFVQFQDTHTKDLFGVNFTTKQDADDFLKAIGNATNPIPTPTPVAEPRPLLKPQSSSSTLNEAKNTLSTLLKQGETRPQSRSVTPSIGPSNSADKPPPTSTSSIPSNNSTSLSSIPSSSHNSEELEKLKKEILGVIRTEMAQLKKELLDAIKNS